MRYTSLDLTGFKRMALNNVSRFLIKPTEQIQMILGTNGSGKSSLMGEMTPLPPNPSDYQKEGFKTIRITHRGNTYVLHSSFANGNKHSFKKNDEEKNEGGTITVQKELVWQEFGITTEIDGLLKGHEKFTAMSAARRREWFTMLSDISYDYALQVYEKLRTTGRDVSGALKLAKKRLVAEVAKVISAEEESKLQREVQEIYVELDLLQSQRAPLDRPISSYESDLDTGMRELMALSQRLLRIRFAVPYAPNPAIGAVRDEWGALYTPAFSSLEEIDEFLQGIKHDISVNEALINKAVEEHTKMNETVKVLIRTGAEGVRSLMDKQVILRGKRDVILQRRKLKLEGIEPAVGLNSLDSITEPLNAIFQAIPENSDKRFGQQKLADLQEAVFVKKDQRAKKIQQLERLVAQKTHLDIHKDSPATTCPKCQHQWVIGYSDQKYAELLQTIAEQEVVIAGIDKELVELELNIAANKEYAEYYKEFVRCARNWPVLRPLWDYLLEQQYVTHSPRKAATVLEILRQDLLIEIEAQGVEDEIAELKDLIYSSEKIGDANLTESKTKLDEITLHIEDLTSKLTDLRKRFNEYSNYRKQLAEAFDLSQRISLLRDNLERTNQEMVEMIRRDTLNHCIRHLQSALARKQETLDAVVLQKKLIQDLEEQIEKLTIDEEAAKALVKQLSPTDGLIAEGLLGFIRSFTAQMNNLIRKIWSYPLQIQDCGVSTMVGAELDYKFPMLVETKTNIVPDVSKGSSGMQEIINLAFKVAAMKYLGLAESPIFLDEFGASFDETHRFSATLAIKNLMEQQSFTQLFMVSHYEASYGAFTNAEICVLCPNNIVVPSSYNKHVVIE